MRLVVRGGGAGKTALRLVAPARNLDEARESESERGNVTALRRAAGPVPANMECMGCAGAAVSVVLHTQRFR